MGLGDDLMWLGEAAKVHEQNPDAVITDGREMSPMWKHHDWIVKPDYQGSRRLIRVPRKPGGERWYIKRFAGGRIEYKNYNPTPAPYVFDEKEINKAVEILRNHGIENNTTFVIINPDTKNTTLSSNKDWGFDKWQQLTNMLSPHVKVVRVKPGGPVNDVSGHVQYKQKLLDNAINIMEDDVRVSFAIMSGSQAIITSEGGLHHFAAAINKPAFVLYGGAIHPDQTGYDERNQTYYVYNDPKTPCGMQSKCEHCRRAMAAIKPQMIYDDVMEYLNQ
jgi:ADP-heptose:LPS heptosyltransferase